MKNRFVGMLDLIVLVAGLAGLTAFVVTWPRLYPEAAVGSMMSGEEFQIWTESFVRDPDIVVPKNLGDMRYDISLRQQGTITKYLQERYGLSHAVHISKSLEVFAWQATWQPPEQDNVQIRTGQGDEDDDVVDREWVEIQMTGQGVLTRFQSGTGHANNRPASTETPLQSPIRVELLSVDSARSLAMRFLRAHTRHDLTEFRETNVRESGDRHEQSFHFTFVRQDKPYGLEHGLSVDVQNGRVRLFESTWKLPPDFIPHKDRWLDKSQGILAIVLLVLFSALTIVYFLRRFRSGAFDYRLGVVFGTVCAAAFSGMMILLIRDSSWLGLLLVVVLGGGWWALCGGVIVVVSASLAREAWPEKYQTFEAIRRGRFINQAMGAGIVRACAWSFLTLGIINAILLALPETAFTMDDTSRGKFEFQGAVFLAFVGVFSSMVHYHTYILLTLSAIRRRWKSRYTLFAVGLLVNLLSLPFMGTISPLSSRLAIGIVVAFVGVFLLIRYDFLTVIVFGFLTYFIQEAWVFVGIHDVAQMTWMAVIVGGLIALGIIGLLSRETGDDVLEYVPEYVREIETKQRMEREFEIARQIQTTFLCCKVPHGPSFELATVCDPAHEVGGDYFDFIRFDQAPHKLGVIIGDVSGKGVSAAFYMTLIKGIMQTQASLTTDSTRETLARANDIFYDHVERGKFISMIYAIFDFQRRVLRISRAGHNPVLVKQSEKLDAEPLLPKGIAIGLTKGHGFADALQEVDVPFTSGDVFTLYTDGFSEAMNKHGDEFGEERLYQLIQQHAHESPHQIMDAVRSEVSRFVGQTPQHDDMTMIIVKIT